MKKSLHVTTFASTSNLGPGFDMLGLCLDFPLRVELTATTGETDLHFETLTNEASTLPVDETNLVVRALRMGLTALDDKRTWSFRLALDSEIPVARGLGSSGAAIAAGLHLASLLLDRNPAEDEALWIKLGSDLEGHPDNVVASLLGGCVLTLTTRSGYRVMHPLVHGEIGFAVAWGNTPMPTSFARTLLPKEIPFKKALDQPRRLAALLEGLRTGDREWLRHGERDYLHADARLTHIPGGSQALSDARAAGAWLATVSGSGSSLVALGEPQAMPDICDAMRSALESADGPTGGRVCKLA